MVDPGLGGLPALRVDQQSQAPQTAVTPGAANIIRARIVIITGGPGSGIFIYSPAPGLGNLIGSWAGTAGVDQFGNSYPQGLTDTVGVLFGSVISGGQLSLSPGPFLLYGNAVTVQTTLTGAGNFGPIPAGVTALRVQAWAPGAGTNLTFSIGQGGPSGGEYSEEPALAVTPGLSYPYSALAGTTGPGTNATFAGDAVTVTAHGGNQASGTTGAPAASGSTNTIRFPSGAGGTGSPLTGGGSGGGGSSAGPGQAGNSGGNAAGSLGGHAGAAPPGGAAGGRGGAGSQPAVSGSAPGGAAGPPGGNGTGTGVGGAAKIVVTYSPPGGAVQLLAALASSAGIDPALGTPYPGPGLGLASTPAPAGVAGFAALYGAAGQPAYVNPAGFRANMGGAQAAATNSNTVTSASLSTLRAGTILATDPAAQVLYSTWAFGSGTWGSTAQNLQLQASLNALSLGSVTIGAGLFPISTPFRWRARIWAVCVAPGVAGTWLGGIHGEISASGAVALVPTAGANASMGFVAGVANPITVDTTVSQTLALQAAWASTTGAPTITSNWGLPLERKN